HYISYYYYPFYIIASTLELLSPFVTSWQILKSFGDPCTYVCAGSVSSDDRGGGGGGAGGAMRSTISSTSSCCRSADSTTASLTACAVSLEGDVGPARAFAEGHGGSRQHFHQADRSAPHRFMWSLDGANTPVA
ncbi:hypothetical protein Vretimale_6548, partial [Volvox reticuliferus]